MSDFLSMKTVLLEKRNPGDHNGRREIKTLLIRDEQLLSSIVFVFYRLYQKRAIILEPI